MTSTEIRQKFLKFFKDKGHEILPSAPMVVKNDPTLMFTNAGMNQFKDIFLGNRESKYRRVADTQKCLRVSGKHNDLEEVGIDTYHHTMFEMLGNWSFGDYFKKEAIVWAWELLTKEYKIDSDRIYVTVFGGDEADGLLKDAEAYDYWKGILEEERICYGSKKDNFWEMGDTGPCGPCSEIHVDLRSDAERTRVKAQDLINKDNPLVIEIWNLVFIEYNRQSDGKLLMLPAKHVDTGMGLERLCMVVQKKTSNYDTDVFQPIIEGVSKITGIKYGKEGKTDIAMRVVADHLRAISFAIADGQLPSNNKAGYVIRRILRRAVRYGYSYLGMRQPFINELVDILGKEMGEMFPEIIKQKEHIKRVIAEEEQTFIRTLSSGIKRFEEYIKQQELIRGGEKMIDGKFAFELLDTYGFPIDLTELMAKEQGLEVHMEKFNHHMEEQKLRSREATGVSAGDWKELGGNQAETEFVGYESIECEAYITRYRKLRIKGEEYYQLVLDKTPFYAESGGQVGDRGELLLISPQATVEGGQSSEQTEVRINVEDTKKENELTVHIVKNIPLLLEESNLPLAVKAKVDIQKRRQTMNNHSATHLMNAALREVLGRHVEQKGSLVDENHLRFDFTHYSKLKEEEIEKIERIVNSKIRENIIMTTETEVPLEKATKEMGAIGVFGERYGEKVRVVSFDKEFSIELCGGTHVTSTGQIGIFKILTESAIAAGIRRIEAITAERAEDYLREQMRQLTEVKALLKNPKDIIKGVKMLIEDNSLLQKHLELMKREKVNLLKDKLLGRVEEIEGIGLIAEKVEIDIASVKDLAFSLNKSAENLFIVLGNEKDGKVNLTVMLSENLIKEKGMNAIGIIKELSKEINGGGGGTEHFATAGGKNPNGLGAAFEKARAIAKGKKQE